MSTSKHFDKICCVVLAVVIVISALFVNGEKLGLTIMSKAMGYESKLFDQSYVHTINIIMDDWDSFLETCTSEEYSACSLVIDNEAYKNVAIRGKGNTSLSSVKNYGNNRYSFKVEFDAYDKTKTYYGLDKLCLNNIIQDNTYMKDYLSYSMMNEFGVAAPLCSYVYITVNGEDWGLYLAVEGVEDSFLQRNYGNDDVNLYKPDSMSMGGGRGNGEEFDMDKFNEEQENAENNSTTENSTAKEDTTTKANNTEQSTQSEQQNGNNQAEPPGGFGGGGDIPEMPEGDFDFDFSEIPEMPEGGFDGEIPEMPNQGSTDSESTDGTAEDSDGQSTTKKNFDFSEMKDKMGGGSPGGMNSDDVKLIYSDDEFDSYSNIFDNAKTDISDSDKETLIASLKSLNEETDLENTVDIEQVIRYFVVHNFVLNGDSYTGSMIHNYYLSENDGQLAMIPWDYNLAFGGFQSMGGAESLVNSPIDSPVSGGDTDSRPMLAWILNSEEYTAQYHELFSEFISSYFDSGKFATEIDRVKEMISPYVEKDPTKFCTYDEFVKGIDTLKEFCLLRAQSVTLQLNGTIGSTSETQTDTTNFVKADDITVSDMGSMGNMGGGGGGMDKPDSKGGMGKQNSDSKAETETDKTETDNSTEAKTEKSSTDNSTEAKTEKSSTDNSTEAKTEKSNSDSSQGGGMEKPSGDPPDGGNGQGGGTPPQMPDGQGGGETPSQMPSGQMPGNQNSANATQTT